MNTLCPKKTTLFKKSSKILSSNMMKARNDTFFKKAYELSTLCDVDVCVLHYGRDGDLIKTWPEDQSKVRDMAERFAKLSKGEKAKKSTNLSQFLNKKITDDKKHDFDKLSEKLSAMESSLLRRLPLLQEKLRRISTDLSIVDQTCNKPCPVSTTDLSSSSMIVDVQTCPVSSSPSSVIVETCPVSTTNVSSSSVTVVENQTEALKNHMTRGHEDEMINTKENGNKYTVFVYDHEKRIFTELGNSSLPMLKENNYTIIVLDNDKKTFTPLGTSVSMDTPRLRHMNSKDGLSQRVIGQAITGSLAKVNFVEYSNLCLGFGALSCLQDCVCLEGVIIRQSGATVTWTTSIRLCVVVYSNIYESSVCVSFLYI